MIFKEGQKPVKIGQFLRNLRIDNAIGMVFAEVIQWFHHHNNCHSTF